MNHFDSGREQANATGLFLRINALAIGLPLGSLLLLFVYQELSGVTLSRADWRSSIMIVWLCTILCMFREGLKRDGSQRSFLRLWQRQDTEQALSSTRVLGKWENKRSLQLGTEFFIAGFIVPGISLFLSYTCLQVLGKELTSANWRLMVALVCLAAVVLLFRVTLRALRQKML